MFDQVLIPVTGKICMFMVHHYINWVQIYILLELIFSYRNTLWNPREFEKSGVKLQCLTEEGKLFLVRVIGRFKKLRAREITFPL